MTKPTLEQKIVRAIADGDEAVAEALCRHLWRGRTRVVYRLAAGGV
jgi:DNA-binding GntR family transcriptional regulator